MLRKLIGRPIFWPFLLLGAAFAVTLHHLRHLYLANYFGFHDLGLINDFLASLFHQGRVFRVFDVGVNHLAWHFTPSLFLITPLYALFSSQFLLLAWSTIAAFAGYAVFVAGLDGLLARDQARISQRILGGLILACLAGLGPFPWRIATSGHFEPLFILASALMLWALLREARLIWVVLPFALALGTREDAGFFVAFQLGSLLFLPKGLIADRRRLVIRALALAVIGALWTAFVVKAIFPAFGMNANWHAQRLWPQFGATFGEIAVNLVLHPGLLFHALHDSAFLELNRSFLWLPWLDPPLALAVNAPGALFYTTISPDRKHLLYYTSAMLLPGMLLAASIGIVLLRRWCARAGGWRPATAALAILLLPAIFTSRFLDRIRDENQQFSAEHPEQIHFIDEALRACPSIHSVASDFRTVVFLPNRVEKYLLWNYGRADAVIYASANSRFTPGLPPESARQPDFQTSMQALAYLAHDHEYHLVGAADGLQLLVRSGIPCSESFAPEPEAAETPQR